MLKKVCHLRLLGYGWVIIFGLVFLAPVRTQAAVCTNPSNYGTATLTVQITEPGEYIVWSRLYAPSASSQGYQLGISTNCWQVGGTSLPASSWTWVSWHGGATTQKVTHTFSTTGSHEVKLIGVAPNIHIDKLIFIGVNEVCSDGTKEPTGTGENCANAPAAGGGTTPVQPGSDTLVPNIVQQYAGQAKQTKYFVNGQLVQTSDGAAGLDTSKLEPGTYEVETVVLLDNGTEVRDKQTVTISPRPSFFARHKTKLFIALSLLLLGAVVGYGLWKDRQLLLSARELVARLPLIGKLLEPRHHPNIHTGSFK